MCLLSCICVCVGVRQRGKECNKSKIRGQTYNTWSPYTHADKFAILPIQCKGVMELHMWMGHGVKGRKLLQRLHQLHDSLIILDDKEGTC